MSLLYKLHALYHDSQLLYNYLKVLNLTYPAATLSNILCIFIIPSLNFHQNIYRFDKYSTNFKTDFECTFVYSRYTVYFSPISRVLKD